jgi:hypothetical protein
VAARVGLVVGGLVCLVLTSPRALAYQRAYRAGEGEMMNAWIKQVDWLSWVSGLDAISTYQRYGAMFGFALAVVAFCLAVVVRSGDSKWERRGCHDHWHHRTTLSHLAGYGRRFSRHCHVLTNRSSRLCSSQTPRCCMGIMSRWVGWGGLTENADERKCHAPIASGHRQYERTH